ncbi:MAG: S24 family peptidase [Methylobacterium sp.]
MKVEELSLHACRLAVVQVPAGFPSPAGDDLEDSIDPIAWIVRHESSTFWWKVSGNSLVNEGICDGDLIAVDRAGKKRLGRIVLAVVDGGITLKKLARRDGVYYLDPSSDDPRQARQLRSQEEPDLCGDLRSHRSEGRRLRPLSGARR